MTMQEKISALTPEQRGQLKTVKTPEQLDAFLAANKLELTDEEKGKVAELFKAGELPLSDEELDDVAGGLFMFGGSEQEAQRSSGC